MLLGFALKFFEIGIPLIGKPEGVRVLRLNPISDRRAYVQYAKECGSFKIERDAE